MSPPIATRLVTFAELKLPSLVLPDTLVKDFDRDQPYPYRVEPVRAILFEGRWYKLAPDCPEDGYGEWAPGPTPEEEAKEATILALDPATRAAIGLANFKTHAERVAQKQADDAAAEERHRLAKEQAAADAAAKAAEAEARFNAAVEEAAARR